MVHRSPAAVGREPQPGPMAEVVGPGAEIGRILVQVGPDNTAGKSLTAASLASFLLALWLLDQTPMNLCSYGLLRPPSLASLPLDAGLALRP